MPPGAVDTTGVPAAKASRIEIGWLSISEEFTKRGRGSVRLRDSGAKAGVKLYTIVPAEPPPPVVVEEEPDGALLLVAQQAFERSEPVLVEVLRLVDYDRVIGLAELRGRLDERIGQLGVEELRRRSTLRVAGHLDTGLVREVPA